MLIKHAIMDKNASFGNALLCETLVNHYCLTLSILYVLTAIVVGLPIVLTRFMFYEVPLDNDTQVILAALCNGFPLGLCFFIVFIHYCMKHPNSVQNRIWKWIDRNVNPYVWLVFGVVFFGPMFLFNLTTRLTCDLGNTCDPDAIPSVLEILTFGMCFICCIQFHRNKWPLKLYDDDDK